MNRIKHSNQIFLFPCIQQLIPNFSRMQMETNDVHVRNETRAWGGLAAWCGGVGVAGWDFCILLEAQGS